LVSVDKFAVNIGVDRRDSIQKALYFVLRNVCNKIHNSTEYLSAKNTGYQKIEYPLNCPTTIERQATEKDYTATTTQNYKFISTAEQENIVIPVFCLE